MQTAGLQEIQVQVSDEGVPLSIKRSGRNHRVLRIYDHWRVAGEWWGSEMQRDYFRVEIGKGLVYDIYHDTIGGRWYLTKIQDWANDSLR